MKIAYAGTHRFAVLVLNHLLGSTSFREKHALVGCITTPDRPRGRHGTPQPSPLKERAQELGLPVLQPERLDDAFVDELARWEVSTVAVCAYGRIVPKALLDRFTWLVVHPSLLPRWRGAAPVERALLAGETELGVAVIRMTEGLDEGPVAAQRSVHVPRSADAGEAYRLLAGPAAEALAEVLDALEAGNVVWREQRGEASYAAKLSDADRFIDWGRPAVVIADQVRALSPWIGAVTELAGRRVIVWRVQPLAELPQGHKGDRLILATGEGWLEILELQEAGRRRIAAQEYLRGAGRRLAQG